MKEKNDWGLVNKNLIREKSDTVLVCLQRVQSKKGKSLDALIKDIDAQDIIVLNLERCIQACVDIASHLIAHTDLPAARTMSDSFAALQAQTIVSKNTSERMQRAVGLRNILVHEYKKIDWDIVWSVLQDHLDDFSNFIQEVDEAIKG